MSTAVASYKVTPSTLSNLMSLLRARQRSLVKRGKANPGLAMLALTAVLYFWLGRLRSKKTSMPQGAKRIPRLKSQFFMVDIAMSYVRSRLMGNELQYVQRLSKQGFTLTTDFVGHSLILAFEPSSVQHILVKNFENYPK
ncbi:hypothetical protein DFQ27_007707, partial [Actinomortierella ambigua]